MWYLVSRDISGTQNSSLCVSESIGEFNFVLTTQLHILPLFGYSCDIDGSLLYICGIWEEMGHLLPYLIVSDQTIAWQNSSVLPGLSSLTEIFAPPSKIKLWA